MLPTVNQKELEKILTWHILDEVIIQSILQPPKCMLYLLRTGLLGNLGPNSSVLTVWPTELAQNYVCAHYLHNIFFCSFVISQGHRVLQ